MFIGARGPQGLRRPRFSFFRFTCQTARDRDGPTLRGMESTQNIAVEASGFRSGSGTRSPNIDEELRGHAVAPRRRRAELTDYIGVGRRESQHLASRKIRRFDAS